jgi:hypothetical protein
MRPLTVFVATLASCGLSVAMVSQDSGQPSQGLELSAEYGLSGDVFRPIDKAVEIYEALARGDPALPGLDRLAIGLRTQGNQAEVWLVAPEPTGAGTCLAREGLRFFFSKVYGPDLRISTFPSKPGEVLPLPSDLLYFSATSFRAARAAVAQYSTGPPDLCAMMLTVKRTPKVWLVKLSTHSNMRCKALLTHSARYRVSPETFEVMEEDKD